MYPYFQLLGLCLSFVDWCLFNSELNPQYCAMRTSEHHVLFQESDEAAHKGFID